MLATLTYLSSYAKVSQSHIIEYSFTKLRFFVICVFYSKIGKWTAEVGTTAHN